jgi:hypothetical protein
VALGLSSGSAWASTWYPLMGSFGPESGSFTNVQGVAVDSSSGDVYVLDTGQQKLYKFDSAGKPAKFSGLAGEPVAIEGLGGAGNDENELAVDNSAGPAKGDIYVATNNGVIKVIGSDGKALGTIGNEAPAPWGEACGVAVDPSGNVYVGIYQGDVNKYVPKANPATSRDYASSIGGAGQPCNIAVDSAGSVFADKWKEGPVTSFSASEFGSLSASGSVVDAKGSTLAVDPATDDVYVDEGGQVSQFGPHGEPFQEPIAAFALSGAGGSYGIAVNGTSGDIYVSDGLGHVSVFGSVTPSGPPSVEAEFARGIGHSTATLGAQIDPAGSDTTYHFEYGPTTSYGTSVPVPDADIGSGAKGVVVTHSLGALQPGITYHWRVVATSSMGTAYGEDKKFTTIPPVQVDSTSAANVGVGAATLFARVNPLGSATTYHFEYGPTTEYGASTPDVEASSVAGEDYVHRELHRLTENTLYHFRVSSSSAVGAWHGPDSTFMTGIEPAQCPNAAVRTGPSARLPDCRAYELVTPADKNSASQDIYPAFGIAALDGNRFAFNTAAAFGSNPQPDGGIFVFVRSPSGWVTTTLSPPESGESYYGEGGDGGVLFNPVLTRAAVKINPRSRGEEPAKNIFAIGSTGGPFSEIASVANARETSDENQFMGSTRDLSTIVFASGDHTLLGASTGTDARADDVYQLQDGRLSRVDVKSDGSALSPCGGDWGWVSGDGSKVFFESPDPRANVFAPSEPGCSQVPRLYMRVNGTETVEVSEPGQEGVDFLGGSEDGSKVLFIADKSGNGGELEVYLYDTVRRKLTDLGPGREDFSTISADGSTVYWHNGRTESYYRYDTTTGVTQLIARLTGGLQGQEIGSSAKFMANPGSELTTTPEGRFLIFRAPGVASVPLPPGSTAAGGGSDYELYRYDSMDGSVICVSCRPNNEPTLGAAGYMTEDLFGPLQTYARTPRYVSISDNGSYVFFDSYDHLVPQDTNNIGGIEGQPGYGGDVYEWHNGTISLISSGNDNNGAVLMGATPDGSNVFFMTHASLVAQDTDSLGDIYDARIGGGFPTASEPVPCAGDACHSPAAAPNDATPSSSTFSGPGNPEPNLTVKVGVKRRAKGCAKGRVRRKARCVRRQKAKRGGAKQAARRPVKNGRGGGK